MTSPGGFEPGRLFGVDLARGLALLGMFVAHIAPVRGEQLVDGRSAILFATAAGISLGLLTGGASPPIGGRGVLRTRIITRGAVLLLFGLLLHVLQPPLAVILDSYGVGFMLLAPLLFAPRAVLGVVVAVCAIAGPILVRLVSDAAPLESLALPVQPLAFWFATGAYPLLVWCAYLAAGLLAARSDLTATRTRFWMVGVGGFAALLGYGAARVLPWVDATAHSDSTAEAVGSGGLALALVGVLLLVGDLPGAVGRAVRVVLFPLAAAGSMVLTLYTVHVLLLAAIRAAIGEGFSFDDYPEWLLFAFVAGALVAGALWRRLAGRGPLEALLRAVAAAATRGARDAPRVTP